MRRRQRENAHEQQQIAQQRKNQHRGKEARHEQSRRREPGCRRPRPDEPDHQRQHHQAIGCDEHQCAHGPYGGSQVRQHAPSYVGVQQPEKSDEQQKTAV